MSTTIKIFNYKELAEDTIPALQKLIREVDKENFKYDVVSFISGLFGLKYDPASLLSFVTALNVYDVEDMLDNTIDKLIDAKRVLMHDEYNLAKIELNYDKMVNFQYPKSVEVIAFHLVSGGWVMS
ncbi:hypothetical protein [Vallitalea guaymasensis]|uniref:hypothetical protein n=1 Tax=Vallitalea guaymasensis TaxID=1185412 RepID=UPI000DE487B3|nr:hypothetical protein [Vallitalea guaymasensis]